MAWSKPDGKHANQIGVVQIYRRAAGLCEADYRLLLKQHTGAFSSRDPSLTDAHFDKVMAVLELKVELRHARTGEPLPRKIQDPRYWRRRCPVGGKMTTRQDWKNRKELWPQLKARLPEPPENDIEYLRAIAEHACGYRIPSYWQMLAWHASLLTEALKDRILHAELQEAS